MNVVLPEPDGPTRKTNSPLSISTLQSFRATVDPLYVLVTFWNLIMRKQHYRSCGRRVREVRCDILPGAVPELGQPRGLRPHPLPAPSLGSPQP